MKLKYTIYLPILFIIVCGCNSKSSGTNQEAYTPPPVGTIVALAEVPIKEDDLNKSVFSVKIVSTAYSKGRGVYEVQAAWGFNTANSQFTMPRGGEDLKPLLRAGNEPYTYIVGFHHGDDTTFYDYYHIAATNGQMKMGYVKSYSFE